LEIFDLMTVDIRPAIPAIAPPREVGPLGVFLARGRERALGFACSVDR
jgi:hypothetical protein